MKWNEILYIKNTHLEVVLKRRMNGIFNFKSVIPKQFLNATTFIFPVFSLNFIIVSKFHSLIKKFESCTSISMGQNS